MKQFTSKTEHYEALSLSLPCEIFCFKCVFGACLYVVSHSGSLHSYKQTQKRVHLDLILAFPCLLIFHKEERDREKGLVYKCKSRLGTRDKRFRLKSESKNNSEKYKILLWV